IHLLGLDAMKTTRTRRRKSSGIQRRKPSQSRAHATVEAALEATARIVRREGLAGLNTNRIAERAGISVGTLYGYFPDKTAIVVALARRILEQDQAAMQAAGSSVRALVKALVARHRTDCDLRRAVMSVHLGQGLGNEHSDNVEAFIASWVERRKFGHLGAL